MFKRNAHTGKAYLHGMTLIRFAHQNAHIFIIKRNNVN